MDLISSIWQMVWVFLVRGLVLEIQRLFCFSFVCFWHSQALDWIQETGEYYLSTHNSTGESAEETQELLKEYGEFRVPAKVNSGFNLIMASALVYVYDPVSVP